MMNAITTKAAEPLAATTGSRPLVPRGGNDRVYTPPPLATQIVRHFCPQGRVLEPCAGKRAFVHALADCHDIIALDECEIDRGDDFFDWRQPVGWIVTNPPWSQFRAFLNHSMEVADNIVFLVTLNHFFTRARMRDVRSAGFGFVEAFLVDTPPAPWPQSGFQLAAIHIERRWNGPMAMTYANAGGEGPRTTDSADTTD